MNKPRGVLGLSNNQTYVEVAMTKEYTMTQFLNSENIRNEIARRWLDIGRETSGGKRWSRLEAEYPNVNLPAIRILAQKWIHNEDRGRFARICHGFQLSLGHLSSAEMREQKYAQYRNGDRPTGDDDKTVLVGRGGVIGPLELALRILDPDKLNVGDVFSLCPGLLGPALGCPPKSLIDPFRREERQIQDAGWRFEFLTDDYLDYRIQVVAKPSKSDDKQKQAEVDAEKARQVAVLREEAKAATQMLSEILQKLESMG